MIADGPAAQHLVGFDRGGAITLATRLPLGLHTGSGWDPTVVELPDTYTDTLTGRSWSGRVPVADLLAQLPVALMLRD